MASSALRDVRRLLSWPVSLLAVLFLGLDAPAVRAQLIQVTTTPVAENEYSPASGYPSAASVQKPVSTQPTIEQCGLRKANDCSAQAEAKIRTALHEATTMDFTETPLQDVVDYLKEVHHIQIQLDTKALADAGIAPDTAVTRNLKGITLDSSLKLLLSGLELTTVVTNGVLLITTHQAANQMVDVRVHDLSDMIDEDDDAEELAGLLQSLFMPGRPSESKRGEADRSPSDSPGSFGASVQIAPYQKVLLIRAPIIEQEKLEGILSELREKLKAAK
jgi:hypothetical protein